MRQRKRWPYIVVGILVGCPCLLVCLVLLVVRHGFSTVADTLPAELDAARADGMLTEVEDLRRVLKVDPSENAAAEYRQAGSLLKKVTFPPKWDTTFSDFTKMAATPAQEKDVAGVVARAKPAIDAFVIASKKPKIDWNRHWEEGAALLFPEYASLKGAAKLLCAKATLEARAGRMDASFELMKAVSRISAHAGADPTMISALVSNAIETIMLGTLTNILQAHHDPATLAKASDFCRRLPPIPSFQRGLSGELVMMRQAIQSIGQHGGDPFGDPSMFKDLPDSYLVRNPTYRKAWEAKMVHYQRAAFVAAKLSPWQNGHDAVAQVQIAIDNDKSIENHINQALSPIFISVYDNSVKILAGRRTMLAAIELLSQRAKSGRLPATLPDLGADSIDPFTEKPLRYIVSGAGFKVYSLDSDLVDDKGLGPREDKKRTSQTHDVVRSFK